MTDRLDGRIRSLMAELADLAPLPPDLEAPRALPPRGPARRHPARLVLASLASVLVLVGADLAWEHLRSGPSFVTAGQPSSVFRSALENEVSFGYLPAHLALVRDVLVNTPSADSGSLAPGTYTREMDFSATTDVVISTQSPAIGNVAGPEGMDLYLLQSIPALDPLSCAAPGPVSATGPSTFTSPTTSGNSETLEVGGHLACRDPSTVPHSIEWQVSPHVLIQLDSTNLAFSELVKVADALRYDPAVGDCIPGGQPRSDAYCAPGTILLVHPYGPLPASPATPRGTVRIAGGTVDGNPWELSVDPSPGDANTTNQGPPQGGKFSSPSVYFSYGGDSGGAGPDSPPGPWAWVSQLNDQDGQRFVFGSVSDSVTQVTITYPDGSDVTVAASGDGTNDGWHFFAASVGTIQDDLVEHFMAGSAQLGQVSVAATSHGNGVKLSG